MTVKRPRGRRGEINAGTPRNKRALYASPVLSFLLSSPAKRGRGTIRSERSERRMVEGAQALTKLLRRKRSDESRAPSTILLRKMVPLPRYRGEG
jgi:hypothetical protein